MATLRDRAKSAVALAPFVVPAALLFGLAAHRVTSKVGHAGPTLDDAYIHFQYARSFAEGHPLRFHAGEPLSSGATSLLWALLLAPFWLVGFRDTAIVWPAWALSFAALGGLAYEVHGITQRLAGKHAAMCAAAMTFASSGLVWSAASGMEVVPLAWLVARTVRCASAWKEAVEAEPAKRTERARRELVLLAFALPLLRPEGALFSLFAAAAFASPLRRASRRDRAFAALAAVAPLVPTAITFVSTGSTRTSTMVVKLLPGNPYAPWPVLADKVAANVRILVGSLLNGEEWSREFLPHGLAAVWMAGLVAIVIVGRERKQLFRAAGALLFALAMFLPCAYDTFLWNRLRYLWPFFPGFVIGAACATEVASEVFARISASWKAVGPVLGGALAGVLAMHLDFALDDVAESASGIDRQQVTLGRWAKSSLPADARIGVNDTGAIAYFGEHPTFDVVGLTTPSEARYWVAGPGSRFEHYENLYRTSPQRLPTHFIVYPQWMACDVVLGPVLTEAIVTDASILGGSTMRAYVADYTRLGSGARPWSRPGEPWDEVDVADLESEAAHAYDVLPSTVAENFVFVAKAKAGTLVADGGRMGRIRERFSVRGRVGAKLTLVARLAAEVDTRIRVRVNGAPAGEWELGADDASAWEEVSLDLPDLPQAGDSIAVALDADLPIRTFHYWVY